MNQQTKLIIQNIVETLNQYETDTENSFEEFYEQGGIDIDRMMYDFVWSIYLANK